MKIESNAEFYRKIKNFRFICLFYETFGGEIPFARIGKKNRYIFPLVFFFCREIRRRRQRRSRRYPDKNTFCFCRFSRVIISVGIGNGYDFVDNFYV